MPEGRILIVDDDKNQALMLKKLLALEDYDAHVVHSGLAALETVKGGKYHIVLSDLRMPDLNGYALYQKVREVDPDLVFIILTAYGTIETAVDAIKNGVYDYIQKPVDAGQLARVFERALEVVRLRRENRTLREKVGAPRKEVPIIGSAPPMQKLLEQIDMIARSDATILVAGESGTGKELVANRIHYSSPRADGPFEKVNCAAIPENLLEDELFGHERGAFTGAIAARRGRFERAHKGSLFLDEIAEMPGALQAKILRVLQEREFERLGGTETISVDVRLIAATNRNLEEQVQKGAFREDLYYRINVIPIRVPPLRERLLDVPLLAQHFLERSAQKNRKNFKGFSPAAMRKLCSYAWPGNVRELENTVERAVVLGAGPDIGEDDVVFHGSDGGAGKADLVERLFATDLTLDELEREIIEMALERSGGNQSRAARLLGLTRRTLQYRVEKYKTGGDKPALPDEDEEDAEAKEEPAKKNG